MAPNCQLPKEAFELSSLGHIVIVLQRGQQQTLAKAARAQKEQRIPALLQQRNAAGAIDIEIILGDNLIKVAVPVGKFDHDMLPLLPHVGRYSTTESDLMPTQRTPQAFVATWRGNTSTERQVCQQHFLDFCALVDHPTPVQLDPENKFFTFEAGIPSRAAARAGRMSGTTRPVWARRSWRNARSPTSTTNARIGWTRRTSGSTRRCSTPTGGRTT